MSQNNYKRADQERTDEAADSPNRKPLIETYFSTITLI